MQTKKISLEAFKSKELSVGEMQSIMAGSGTSDCWQGHTESTGSDHDNNGGDSD